MLYWVKSHYGHDLQPGTLSYLDTYYFPSSPSSPSSSFFPAGMDQSGTPVFLRDIWPSRAELQEIERKFVIPAMFQEVYAKITQGNTRWNSLQAPESLLYPWDPSSTYIKSPPFFEGMVRHIINPSCLPHIHTTPSSPFLLLHPLSFPPLLTSPLPPPSFLPFLPSSIPLSFPFSVSSPLLIFSPSLSPYASPPSLSSSPSSLYFLIPAHTD